jgi:myo-inositol-1(or 4)-monophosphatase
VAVAAAQAAAGHAAGNRHRRGEVLARGRHDVKLNLDVEAQEAAVRTIHAHFPRHSILGEERTAEPHCATDSPYEWVIDPIDGTVNFSHGLPQWCSSVAVRCGGRTLAGAVWAPDVNELYTAAEDTPAYLNGTPIHVSEVERLDRSMVFTGLDKEIDPTLHPFALFERIALGTQKARVMGAAALDICHVAAGQGDGYFEAGIYIWDIAAASLVVERAGGRSEVLRELPGNRMFFLATNGRIHRALTDLLAIPSVV